MPRHLFWLSTAVVFALAAVFVLTGFCLISYPGIHNDEALFAAGIYGARETPSWISVFGKPMPMMLMSYVGALKAWIYTPVFAVWAPSAYSVRVPVLLIGAATLWMFYRLIFRIQGRRAALIGCALLATDTTFLLTTCLDWGPVVLQHALAVGGALLLVRFHQASRRLDLCVAFFLFGLALWDKAIFGWILMGLTAGILCAHPGALRKALGFRNILLAALCFCAGASPLIHHNVRHGFDTIRTNVGYSTERLGDKVHVLRSSLDGSGLFGYLTYNDPVERPSVPRTSLEWLSVAVERTMGKPHEGLMPYAVAAALLMIPFVWQTRARGPMTFALVCMTVVWAQMFFGRGVGGSVHHTVLLWPWPHLLVAAVFAEGSRYIKRGGAAVAFAVIWIICGMSLLVTNTYVSQFIRNGGSRSWSDAIYALSDWLPTVSAHHIVILDWGIFEPLRLLHQGRLPLVWGTDPLLANPPGEEEIDIFRRMIQSPNRVFISHTNTHEEFSGVNTRLKQLLEAEGYRKEVLKVVPDKNGRPVFNVYRVVPKRGEPLLHGERTRGKG